MKKPKPVTEKKFVKNATKNSINEKKSFVKDATEKDHTKVTGIAPVVTLFCSEKECYPTARSVS